MKRRITMKRLSAENVQTRKTAKVLMQAHRWPLLGMIAVALGIPVVLSMTVSMLLVPLVARMPILYEMLALPATVGISILTCGLMMGMLSAMIGLCRDGEKVTVGAVFRRMSMTFKAFGLNMWVALKAFLWMLPGYGLMMLALIALMVLVIIVYGGVDLATLPFSLEAFIIAVYSLMGVGMVLMLALGLPASYRYMLSLYILADKPDTRINDCVKQSKAMMKGHKWQAFKLIIPIFLVMFVMMMVMAVAFGAPMNLVADSPLLVSLLGIGMLVVYLALALYYSVRMYLCHTIFYLKRVEEQPAAEELAPAEETAAE